MTEVPSLPSSQQRHSKKSDFQPSSGATPQGGSGRGGGGGGGGGGNDGGVGAPGYENMRPQGGAVGDPGYQNTREPSAFQNHSSHQSSNSSQHRQRRTQRKVTHNEKRYHSGMYETIVIQLLYISKLISFLTCRSTHRGSATGAGGTKESPQTESADAIETQLCAQSQSWLQ